MRPLRIFLTVLLACNSNGVLAKENFHNSEDLQSRLTEFLIGLPGLTPQARIRVEPLEQKLRLHACDSLEFFMPNSINLSGNIRVGVRCLAPQPWSIFTSVNIQQVQNHFVTRAAIEAGKPITLDDLVVSPIYSESPAPGLVSNEQQLIGRTLTRSLPANTTLRKQDLRAEPALTRGQTVKISAKGSGYQVTAEGQALATAMAGQITQARMPSGRVVTGSARHGGIIEIE